MLRSMGKDGGEEQGAGLGFRIPALTLAFTRYCHCQYIIVYGIQRGSRGGGVVYCVIVVR